ncbi:MAG: uroporphyrinogen decarboxylase family protein [Candidatus Coatesbacteria bacterium]
MPSGSGVATDLEIFRDTVAHRRPSRVLYHFDCTPDLNRRMKDHVGGDGDWFTHYGCFGYRSLWPKRPAALAPLDFAPYWKDEPLPPGSWVNHLGVLEVPGSQYHFTAYVSPLRRASTLAEIDSYPIDNVSTFDTSWWADEVKRAHAAGRPAGLFVGHMYENSWQIRGYEPFLEDMIERPAWAHSLLERFFRNNLHQAVEAAKAGADLIQCGDDVANQRNMMFSVPMWRDFILSRWAQVWKAAKAVKPDVAIHYHSDGNVMAIIPEMVDAGLNILNPVQPECVDTDEIHRMWGTRLSFDGCLGTQTTMPFGTPADVRTRVRECVDKYGRNGGLILSPTHVLEPEVPIANIEAFVQACRDFGPPGK